MEEEGRALDSDQLGTEATEANDTAAEPDVETEIEERPAAEPAAEPVAELRNAERPVGALDPAAKEGAANGPLPAALRPLSKEADITPVEGGYLIQFADWACKIHGPITAGRVNDALARRPS